MLSLVGIIFAVLAVLIAIKKEFIPVWVVSFNVIFSIHTSLLIVALLGRNCDDLLPTQITRIVALFLVAALLFLITSVVAKLILQHANEIDLPNIFSMIIKPITAAFAGWFTAWFIVFLIATATVAIKPDMAEKFQAAKDRSANNITICSRIPKAMAMCEDKNVMVEILNWLANNANKPNKTTIKAN